MAGFTIKNLSPLPLSVMGIIVLPSKTYDLLSSFTGTQIIDSLMTGELYSKLQGRLIAVTDIAGFNNLGATQAQLDFFARCSVMQGFLQEDDLKYPFKFTHDGYLETTVTGITLDTSGLEVEVRGDRAVPADRDSILAMGTDDGTINGTVHVMKIGSDGYVQVKDMNPTESAHNYSTTRGDGVAVRLSDTTITFTGPAITSNQIRKVIVNTGTAFNFYEQAKNGVYITISGTTITIAGAGAAPVPAGSTVEVLWAAQDKAYDPSVQAMRVAPVYSDASRSILQDCSQATAAAGGTVWTSYLDMFGYRGFSIQLYSTAGTYTKTLKLYVTNQDDGTAPASCVYNDVSLDWMGAASVVIAAGATTGAYFFNKPTNAFVKYVKIEVTVGVGATVDNTMVMYARKVY